MMREESQVIIDYRLKNLAGLSRMKASQTLSEALRRAAIVVVGLAKKLVYLGHPQHLEGDTGRLRKSLQYEIRYPEAYVGSNVIYAPVHEYGATIRPKTKPRLAWQDKEGQWHSALQVTIPARPYLRPALEAARDDVERIFGNTIYTELMGGAAE